LNITPPNQLIITPMKRAQPLKEYPGVGLLAPILQVTASSNAADNLTVGGALNAPFAPSYSFDDLQRFGNAMSVTLGSDTYTGVFPLEPWID
jgi:hypothetical protein